MRKIQQAASLALAAALCLSLAACGGAESGDAESTAPSSEASEPAESEAPAPAADDADAADAEQAPAEAEPAEESDAEESDAEESGDAAAEMSDNLAKAIEEEKASPADYIRCTIHGEGSLDGNEILFDSTYEHEQLDESIDPNLYESWSLSMEQPEEVPNAQRVYADLVNYYTDGTYYSGLISQAVMYECPTPSVSRLDFSLADLATLAIGSEMTLGTTGVGLDQEAEIYTFTISGDQVRDLVAMACPPLMLDLEGADWSTVTADVKLPVDIFTHSIEGVTLDSPSLGALLLQSAAGDMASECTSFTMELFHERKWLASDPEVYTPADFEMALLQGEGAPIVGSYGDLCAAMESMIFAAG